MKKTILFLFVLIFLLDYCRGQNPGPDPDSLVSAKDELFSFAEKNENLHTPVELSVSQMPIQEFLRNVSKASQNNIYISPEVEGRITNNFYNVSVLDILLFLEKEHQLQIKLTGNIISVLPPETKPRPIIIEKISDSGYLLNLRNDTLFKIAEKLTRISGVNVITDILIRNNKISTYLEADNLEEALQGLCKTNNLEFEIQDNAYYITASGSRGMSQKHKSQSNSSGYYDFRILNNNNIYLNAREANIEEVITAISEKLPKNFFFLSETEETISLLANDMEYESLLDHILDATDMTWQKQNDIYIIGSTHEDFPYKTEVIELKNRAVSNVIDILPAKLLDQMEVIEFPNQNSLVVCGSQEKLDEFNMFIEKIDHIVPLILIEVIIIEQNSNYLISTGINMGISDKPVATSGSVLPLDMTLGASSINNMINSLNGFGWLNIGNVTPNFYVALKALEDQGYLSITNTPKLSALNGTEASLTIGKTEYYIEEKENIFANQTTTQSKTTTYQPVNADFIISINPLVSSNDYITLDVSVDQTDFTGEKINNKAPPEQVHRNFKSLIRIKNEEMVLLGGLEFSKDSETGSGIPVLNRIPVLKWLFSSKTKEKTRNKLSVFIKPTVIY